MSVTIYHNPACGTSRNTLELIRNAGIAPVVIEYLQQPPDRATLADMIAKAGMTVRAAMRQATLADMIAKAGLTVRAAMRQKESLYQALGLDAVATTDDALLDAMLAHPILINRPFVVTPAGVRLCRPSEVVLDILTESQRGAFIKEDGERVIDDLGQRVPHG